MSKRVKLPADAKPGANMKLGKGWRLVNPKRDPHAQSRLDHHLREWTRPLRGFSTEPIRHRYRFRDRSPLLLQLTVALRHVLRVTGPKHRNGILAAGGAHDRSGSGLRRRDPAHLDARSLLLGPRGFSLRGAGHGPRAAPATATPGGCSPAATRVRVTAAPAMPAVAAVMAGAAAATERIASRTSPPPGRPSETQVVPSAVCRLRARIR